MCGARVVVEIEDAALGTAPGFPSRGQRGNVSTCSRHSRRVIASQRQRGTVSCSLTR